MVNMANMNFNTANKTLRQLLSNGLSYKVPWFQRDYSWTEEEWDDLWQDILEITASKDESAHYMGYVVLQSKDNEHFDIIDGQQRLTTISLLVLAVLKNLHEIDTDDLENENNQKRIEQLRSIFIGFLDPVTLVPKSKLELNRNNDSFYQNYLVPLEDIPQRGLKNSEKLIKKSFEFFYSVIKKHFKETSDNKKGVEMALFLETIAAKLFFTEITVSDELNAFKVFETLNARGVRLSSTDLLKNYLFSVVSSAGTHEKTEIETLEERWHKIIDKLGAEDFPTFLRFYWNSQNTIVRQKELFKKIRSRVSDKKLVFELIRNLEHYADIYMALKNPSDELWNIEPGQYKQCSKYVGILKMFSIKQPISLLMTAFKQMDSKEFYKLLRKIVVISFRYNVISGLHTGEQEMIYNKIAVKISKKEITNANKAGIFLQPIYTTDDVFKAAFADKELSIKNSRNKKIVKYILFELEKTCLAMIITK